MADIDFEELDKAVSSLMGGAPGRAEGFDRSQSGGPLAASPNTSLTQPSAADMASRAPLTIASRPAGRFMDVKPPTAAAHRSPAAATSREGLVVEPAVNQPEPVPASSQAEVKAPPAVESFDPLMGDSLPDSDHLTLVDKPQAEVDPASEQLVADTPLPESELPLESPFLSNITVEKRPLGGDYGSPSPSYSPEVMPDYDSLAQDDDIQTPPEAVAPELGKEIMELESRGVIAPTEETLPAQDAEPVVELVPSEEPIAAAAELLEEKAVPETVGDILPQYSSEADEASQPSPMFEVAADQPAESSLKKPKKSGWSIVLFLILFLLVGAGGGAAIYLLLL